MKLSLLSALVCTATASPLLQNSLNKRQQLADSTPPRYAQPGDLPSGIYCPGPGGKVGDPTGHAPLKVEMKSDSKIPGTKRVKLRYGPYKVPNMMVKSIMGEGGALFNCANDAIDKPCEECSITRIEAGLEYPNGTNANIDSGMWLHHMVLSTVGPGRWDPTCFNEDGALPHFATASTPKHSERSFASGNERTPADLNLWSVPGKKAAYHIKKTDVFRTIVDLMNMNMDDRVVYLTMTWDFLDGPLPDGYLDLKPVWFDADQCGLSEVKAPQNKGQFTLPAKPWYPNFEGDMIGLGGHLHDGGVVAQMFLNDTVVCDSVAKYAEKPEFVFKGASAMASGEKFAEKHISSMNACYFSESHVLDKKTPWTLKAKYDYEKFTGNLEADGDQANIMSIAIAYAAVKPGGVPMPS